MAERRANLVIFNHETRKFSIDDLHDLF